MDNPLESGLLKKIHRLDMGYPAKNNTQKYFINRRIFLGITKWSLKKKHNKR